MSNQEDPQMLRLATVFAAAGLVAAAASAQTVLTCKDESLSSITCEAIRPLCARTFFVDHRSKEIRQLTDPVKGVWRPLTIASWDDVMIEANDAAVSQAHDANGRLVYTMNKRYIFDRVAGTVIEQDQYTDRDSRPLDGKGMQQLLHANPSLKAGPTGAPQVLRPTVRTCDAQQRAF